MPALSRRALLGLGGTAFAGRVDAQPAPIAIGAIRWDAWYAPETSTTEAMVRSLSPGPWRARAPFFAEVPPGDTPIRFPRASQDVMDQEILRATAAGLDYWAFVSYPLGNAMSEGLRLYRASSLRDRINFCFITEAGRWGRRGALSEMFDEHPPLLADPHYQRVAGGRPLYFLGFISDDLLARNWGGVEGLRAAVDEFRRRVQSAGASNPYIVLMTASPDQAQRWLPQLGADAVSAYAYQANDRQASYAALASYSERGWAAHAARGLPVIPTVMSGWDRRPRVQNPVPWEGFQRQGEGMDRFYTAPTPSELSRHVQRAIAFAQTQPARAALIYAWNENDEGGWLIPTRDDDSRLRAVRGTLCVPEPVERCVRR